MSTVTHEARPTAPDKRPDAVTSSPTSPRSRVTFADLRHDRVADLVRVAALGVVIVWHSTLSLFHRQADGSLSMPNPIGQYQALWLATWVLQVMPLFFVVSGAVNADAWERHRQRGGTAWTFTKRRVARFVRPVGVLVALCAAAELVARALGGGPLLARNLVVVVPLWTLGLLLAYAPLTPLLHEFHLRHGAAVTTSLVATVAVADLIRFEGHVTAGGAVSTVVVWLLAYHLGWVYRAARRHGAARCRREGRTLVLAGLCGLIVSTNIGVYPRSMVATSTDPISNLLPTTFPIAALALAQCGLLLWARPALDRWLRRDDVWRTVTSLGRLALPAYLLHMIPVVVVVRAVELLHPAWLPQRASTGWWLSRPLWFALVAVVGVPVLGATQVRLRRNARVPSGPSTATSALASTSTGASGPSTATFTVATPRPARRSSARNAGRSPRSSPT